MIHLVMSTSFHSITFQAGYVHMLKLHNHNYILVDFICLKCMIQLITRLLQMDGKHQKVMEISVQLCYSQKLCKLLLSSCVFQGNKTNHSRLRNFVLTDKLSQQENMINLHKRQLFKNTNSCTVLSKIFEMLICTMKKTSKWEIDVIFWKTLCLFFRMFMHCVGNIVSHFC